MKNQEKLIPGSLVLKYFELNEKVLDRLVDVRQKAVRTILDAVSGKLPKERK